MTARRHLAADRSEMQRHGLGVRRWQDQACCDATLRTGRAKQVGPARSVGRARAGPRSTLGQTRVSVPCWPIRASSWERHSIGLLLARSGDLRRDCRGKVFLNVSWVFVSLRVAGPYRQLRELEPLGVNFQKKNVRSGILMKLGYRKLSVRPRHPQADEEAQETFKKTLPRQSRRKSRYCAKSKPIEIWFQDEARIGQQGTLTRVWAKRGTRPRAPHDQRYDLGLPVWRGLSATSRRSRPGHASGERRGHVAASHCDRLQGGGRQSRRSHPRWRRLPSCCRALRSPKTSSLVRLPPYAPELNPIENVWEYLRNKLAITVFDDYDDIVDKTCDAWNFFEQDPMRIASITTRTWATVND